MIKLVTILKSNDSLTRKEFEERWHGVHAPIAAKFPGLRGYMLSFSIEPGDVAAEGVAQLWFDSRDAAQESYASDIGREGSGDANAYLARREHLLASERWLRRPDTLATRPYKLMLGVKRREGQDRLVFVDWWHEISGDEVAEATGADAVRLAFDEAGKLLNSGTTGELGLREGEAAFDGLLEVWFDSAERAEAGHRRFASSPLREAIVSRAGRHETFLLVENVIVPPPVAAYGGQ